MPMCETKLNQISYRSSTFINSSNRILPYPLISHYDHIPYGEEK